MCGINGIFAYHYAANPPEEIELLATREHMRVRGPDGAGAWWSTDRRCALGHRRLSIIDLDDRAAQPMTEGGLTIVFNGEIYNYVALRDELRSQGVQFRTFSDTEVVLRLFRRDGEAMVNRLRGMFAFAIWNEVERRLFLARDPYGIKPLYVACDGQTFRFASQVKALLAGGQVSREIEPAGLVGFCLFGSVPEPFTLYGAIQAFPAGHTQWVDDAGPQAPRPFFSVAEVLADAARAPIGANELSGRLQRALLDSVQAHLLADVEIGLFLSAGVDSGSLLASVRDTSQRDFRAITLAFEEFRGTEEDEAPYAARIAERYGAHQIVRRVGEREFTHDLPAIFEAMDQPSIDGVNTWFVAKAAKEAGLKVALSGIGGDELLAGYPSFVDVPRWHRRFGAVSRMGLGVLADSLMRVAAPGLARRQPKAVGMFELSGTWAGAYLLRRGLFLPHELNALMNPGLVSEGMRRLDPLRRLGASIEPDPGTDVGRVCALESLHYLRNQLLRDADWAGMAHSIEIRVPLVDVELLKRFAPALPVLKPGEGKAALARAPSLPLPEEIVARTKTGFGVPTGAWISKSIESGSRGAAAASVTGPKGTVSRNWSRRVLPRFLAGADKRMIGALAS